MKVDFIIVGGGPAGCAAALEARRLGFEKVVVIERASLPRLKPCAGGISMRAENLLKEFSFYPELEPLMHKVGSANLTLPNGKCFELKGDASASVMNRQVFDDFLQKQVIASGAEIISGANVENIEKAQNGRTIVRGAKGEEKIEFESSAVVVCAGANHRFHQDTRKKVRIVGCTAWFEGCNFDPTKMELIFDKSLRPHYGWLFPESETTCNIGICLYQKKLNGRSVLDVYQDFIQKYYSERMKNATTLVSAKVHPILPARSIRSHGLDGTLLAGDASRLVNAFTGEGISYALLSGKIAVQAWAEGLKDGWSWERINKQYENLLKKEIRGSMKKGFLLAETATPLLILAGLFADNSFVKKQVTKHLSKV
ncbi:MAG: NAD(P)/FAD-dependent oxidoreductase [Spirochaetales bacterium]|nr:NAD(P)/FAD-dependent oxidoreductase [Spirochaetales bacterium]